MTPDRTAMLTEVARLVAAGYSAGPTRVAVDGITAAGKTTFADELAAAILDRPVQQLSGDDFHHPSEHRYRNPDPAAGYYEDAYDFAALADAVTAIEHDVLIVEGTFLQRDLRELWDVVIWLDVPYDVARERAMVRDAALFGGPDATDERYRLRYHAACRLYVAAVDPLARADVVIDNADPARPSIMKP